MIGDCSDYFQLHPPFPLVGRGEGSSASLPVGGRLSMTGPRQSRQGGTRVGQDIPPFGQPAFRSRPSGRPTNEINLGAMLQAREQPGAHAIRCGFRQMLQARALFKSADIGGDRLRLGKRAFKTFDQRMIGAAPDLHPRRAEFCQQAFKGSDGSRIQIRPAFGFHDNQPRGLHGCGHTCRAEKPGCTRVSPGTARDFDGNCPHIGKAIGMHPGGGLAERLPLAAIDGALRGFQRDIAAIGSRANDGPADLRANRRRDHIGGNGSGGA